MYLQHMKKKSGLIVPDESIFRDREKEAKFWEEHFDEAWEAGKPVKVRFAKNLSETLNMRWDTPTLNRVRKVAKQKGLGPTQLIRMWVMEKLNGGSYPTAA